MFFKKEMDSHEYAEQYEIAKKVGWGHSHRSASEREQQIEEFDKSIDSRFLTSEKTEYLRDVARGKKS